MKIAIVLGTRPEIIKLSSIIKKLNKRNSLVIFTGQHYDYELSMQFIHQLGLRKPDYSLKITHHKPSLQISEIITKLSKILEKEEPDTVIVQGDTNSVLAGGLSSLKSGIPISHVEAGLRSFDWRMPEEHNRIAIDHLSELLFAPTMISKNNLISENVHGRIFVTGNTIIDAINTYSNISKKKSKISVELDNYILMTLHRTENIDDKKILSSIIKGIINSHQDIIFPVHPHTLKRLHEFNLYNKLSKSENVLLLDSVGYFEILELMKNCSFIITDSGGIQEEATSDKIRKKVLVLRKTADRPEAVSEGFSELVGTNPKKIQFAIQRTIKNPKPSGKNSPFGDGHSSTKIISLIKKNI